MKKKWIYIAAGIIGIIGFIGAIVGLYFYVKKTMSKIGKAIDDIFDIEQKADQSKKVHYVEGQHTYVPIGGVIDFGGKWTPYQNTVTGTPNWYHCIHTVNMFDGNDGK